LVFLLPNLALARHADADRDGDGGENFDASVSTPKGWRPHTECSHDPEERAEITQALNQFDRLTVEPFKGDTFSGRCFDEKKEDARLEILKGIAPILLKYPDAVDQELEPFEYELTRERDPKPLPSLSDSPLKPDCHRRTVLLMKALKWIAEAKAHNRPVFSHEVTKELGSEDLFGLYGDLANLFEKDPSKKQYYVPPKFKVVSRTPDPSDPGRTILRLSPESLISTVKSNLTYPKNRMTDRERQEAETKMQGQWHDIDATKAHIKYGSDKDFQHEDGVWIRTPGSAPVLEFSVDTKKMGKTRSPRIEFTLDAYADGQAGSSSLDVPFNFDRAETIDSYGYAF
jgi:hypothetical protein